ncbi:peptidase [Bernardetia sp. OM2101]|uniref:peptidase n=1 Tax=Bernardetia sp. OM2101 TaxID=3344876 RepID=UPI0035CEF5B2
MIHSTLKNLPNEDICLMLTVPNHSWVYLCDCGQASQLSVADCLKVNAIFISHTHIDHFCNFDTIFRHQLGIQRTVTICGPVGIAKNVQAKLLGYTWNLIEADAVKYEIREIGLDDSITIFEITPPSWDIKFIETIKDEIIYKNDVFDVKFTSLNHSIPSIAYLFETYPKTKIQDFPFKAGKWVKELKEAFEQNLPEKNIQIEGTNYLAKDLFSYIFVEEGYKLGYVMDHLASEENFEKIVHLFQKADELFIESYYLEEDKELALKNHHSTAKNSGLVARRAQVKKVNPVHHSRKYNHNIQLLIDECLEAFHSPKI